MQMRQMQAAFLRPIQRILGLPTSSHLLGALVEAHCPSFEAYRTQATARFLLRAEELLQSQPTHPTSQTLLQDRLETPLLQRKRYCAGPLISTPVTNRAETVAIPHLINNVLAHLPRLAPFHPLISRYFPGAANLPAPLPATLTVDEVNSLLMVDTHREWRAEPTMTMASISTAPLLTIKTSPRPSLFLSLECNPLVAIRARLRANRLSTQERRYRQLHDMHVAGLSDLSAGTSGRRPPHLRSLSPPSSSAPAARSPAPSSNQPHVSTDTRLHIRRGSVLHRAYTRSARTRSSSPRPYWRLRPSGLD